MLKNFKEKRLDTETDTTVERITKWGFNAQASFQETGDQRILSGIETGDNIFTIPVSSVAIQETSARSHTSTTSGLSSVGK